MERTPNTSHRRKRRVGRWIVLVLLITAGITGYVLWNRPNACVTAYFAGERMVMVRDPGVLTLLSPSRFFMRRWLDGKPLWEVQAAAPTAGSSPGAWELPISAYYSHGVSTFALSPSGEILATASVQPRGVRLQTWKQGTLCCDVTLTVKMPPRTLPYARYPYFNLAVDNNGRVFFLQGEVKLTVLKAGRIVAERAMPFNAILSVDGRFIGQDPAGMSPAGKNELFAMCITAGKIELKPIGIGEPVMLFSNGNVMTAQGDLYTSTGKLKLPIPAGYHPYNLLGVTAVREWIGMGHRNGAIAVCRPDTGNTWHLPRIARTYDDVSRDGRFVLTGIRPQRPSALQPVIKYLERFFPDLMAQRFPWAIYERPGRLRLKIPQTLDSHSGRLQLLSVNALSPDGKSFVVYVRLPGDPPPPGGTQYTTAFCRW